MDDFQSTTDGHGSSTSLSYQTYYDLLINTCVKYDKTKNINIGKRRKVYNSNIDTAYVDSTPFDFVPDSPHGGIDLPPDEFYQMWKSLRMMTPDNGPSDLPESDLAIPDNPILNFVNSHCHSSEDLDQALQAYQAYKVAHPQDSTPIHERTINHHYTYYVAQVS